MLQRVLGEALVGPILLIAGQQIGRDVLEEAGRDLMLLQALRNARRATGIMVARVIRACMVGAGAKRYVRHGSPSLSRCACRPAAQPHIDMRLVFKGDSLVLKKPSLSFRTAECEPFADASIGEHHAMARNLAGARIAMERKAHVAGLAGLAHQAGDLYVRCNDPLGNLLLHVVHALEESLALHTDLLPRPSDETVVPGTIVSCQARLSQRQLYLAQLSHMLLIGDDNLRVFRGHEGLHANRGTQVALHELSELVDGRLAVVSALRLNTLDDKERIA